METKSQPKKPGTGDTVSITVSITQDARRKLREMKGILSYPTLDKTVNTAVEMVEMRKVFHIAMKAHGLVSQIEPVVEIKSEPKESEIPTYDQSKDEPIDIIESLYGEEEIAMVAFCIELKKKLGYDDIGQIDALIEDGTIKIIDTTKPRISQVGEIPYDIE